MSELPQFDTRVPNPARMWNYWLGGKDNFAADRDAAERFIQVLPTMPAIARLARQFQPIAIMLLAILHFIPDEEDPWEMVGRPPGSLMACR